MSTQGKGIAFACQQCRVSKRRCDGIQPQCSTCQKGQKKCEYITEKKPRKRKYWDENYVKSLENQVQALLALQKKGAAPITWDGAELQPNRQLAPLVDEAHDDVQPMYNASCGDQAIHQSQTAMEELSIMMWRTNLADAVPIPATEAKKETISLQDKPASQIPRQVPSEISGICGDAHRLSQLGALFLENINEEHQFTAYESASFFLDYPDQTPDRLFLHAAMLAAGATFENLADSINISNSFAELSESLVFKCFRHSPSIHVIQGLSILSWRSLALGHDHFGWTFLSMAAGMAVHLRLHVLALAEPKTSSVTPSPADVRTFWSFYMTDRTSVSILGRNCMLPWRRVNVPPIETLYPIDGASLAQISFAWQCKLWYMHDQRMDEIFSSSFETQSIQDQAHLLMTTHENLNNFSQSRHPKLTLKRGPNPKPILLFHMSYQMAILVTMPPFLRLFVKSSSSTPEMSNLMTVVLQSLTSAAASMLRLVQDYCKVHGFEKANPLLIHHLLSASIVHLMNMTTKSLTFRRFSTRSVRKCLYLLNQLGRYWPNRVQKSVDNINALAHRWGVESALLSDSMSDLSAEDSRVAAPAPNVQDTACQGSMPVSSFSPTKEQSGQFSTSLDISCSLDSLLETEGASLAQDFLYPEGNSFDFSILDATDFRDDTDLFQIFREFSNFERNQWEQL